MLHHSLQATGMRQLGNLWLCWYIRVARCRLKAVEQAQQAAQGEAASHAALLATLRAQFKAYQAGKAKEVSSLFFQPGVRSPCQLGFHTQSPRASGS